MRLLATLLGLLSALAPATAYAFEIPTDWAAPVCAFVPCFNAIGGGSAGLSAYLFANVVTAIEIGFAGLAILMLFLGSINMVLYPEQDDVIRQGRMNFVYAIAGAAVVSFSHWIAAAFVPSSAGVNLVNMAPLDNAVTNAITLGRSVLASMLIVNIVVQGIRLVASQGEEEKINRARKLLIVGFVGAGITLLTNIIIVNINPQLGSPNTLALEIAGIANYLITILGFAAAVVIVVAGILLVLSAEESLKEKAKAYIKVAIVGLIAAVVSFALVNAFIVLG